MIGGMEVLSAVETNETYRIFQGYFNGEKKTKALVTEQRGKKYFTRICWKSFNSVPTVYFDDFNRN